ncbi:antirestriction protein ArdA [Faecalispora anaeroviscerum]|uniref:antirestriction protein ArdA n=1 Tax=Faecalispora anaeroviscerum TaxID=2991836 RepID=UPI0024B91D32|nr:antirestriction protein ArdA [Faecalispora anaeroviscerum]
MNIRIKTEHGLTGLELPCREEKIAEFCKGLDTTNNSKTEITVDYVYLNDRANALLSGKTYNLDKLNYLAKRLDSFDKNELTTFYAVAYSEKNNDIDRLINHTFNTHCYSVVRDFSDLDSIGKDMYLTQQGGVTMEELNRLDGEGYFKKVLADNPNPIVTPYGILYRNKNQYEQVYDGSHFPDYLWDDNMGTVTISKDSVKEYLYLPFAESELNKAMERLGAVSTSECDVELDSEFLTDQILASITEGEPIENKLMQLSYFSEKYAELGTREKPYLDALVECLEPRTVKDVNTIMNSLHEFEIFHGIHTAKDYGRYMIIDSGHFEYDENLEEYIDFEKYGSHRLKWENGVFTDQGYILYHGYNMELTNMLSEIGIEVEPQETQTLKLYMPLRATTYYDENDYGDLYQVDFEIEVYPEELAEYEEEILEAIEHNSLPEEKERGLMKYYGENDSVNAKVKRYDFSVENVRGKLMGIATLVLNAPLEDKEMEKIKEEISGQASDGWCEGFEQREIKCNGKEIYVSFWQSKNWSLQTAEELGISEPKQELTMGGM